MLLIDEKTFDEELCKHCMLNGEIGCRYKEEGITCPTISGIKQKAQTITDEEIEEHCREYCEFHNTVCIRDINPCNLIKKLKLVSTPKEGR